MNVKIIDRGVAIGNIVLELFKYGKNEISIEEILSYSDDINNKLHNCEYRVLLGWNNIDEFAFNYPFLCTLVGDTLILDAGNRKDLLYKYNRYFRIGALAVFVQAVQDAVFERYEASRTDN